MTSGSDDGDNLAIRVEDFSDQAATYAAWGCELNQLMTTAGALRELHRNREIVAPSQIENVAAAVRLAALSLASWETSMRDHGIEPPLAALTPAGATLRQAAADLLAAAIITAKTSRAERRPCGGFGCQLTLP